MKSNFRKVEEFMKTFKQEVRKTPSFPSYDTCKLRFKLIQEELQEYQDAVLTMDIVKVADALTDILYVVYGTGHSFGIDLDKCFEEVHNSNLSKLDDRGEAIFRDDGKIMKGPNYEAPNLEKILYNK